MKERRRKKGGGGTKKKSAGCIGACLCTRVYIYIYMLIALYSAIIRSRENSLRLRVILHESLTFYRAFLNIHSNGVLTALTLID